jgi:hypothetical protein
MSRPRDVHPTSIYVERDGARLAVRSAVARLEYDAPSGVWGFGDVNNGFFVAEDGVLGIDEDAIAHDVRVIASAGRILIYGDI